MILKTQHCNLVLLLLMISFLSSCVVCRYKLKNNSISTCKEACDLPYRFQVQELQVDSLKNYKPYKYKVVKLFKTAGGNKKVLFKSSKKHKFIWEEYHIIEKKEYEQGTYDRIPFKVNTWYKIDNLYGGSSLIVTNPDKVKYFYFNDNGKLKQKKGKDYSTGGI